MNHSKYARNGLSLLLISCAVSAQNIPDAGALMRQNEQNIRFSQTQQALQLRDSLPLAMPLNDGTLFTPQRFEFKGHKRLSTEQLQQVALPFANKPLNQHDLQQLTHAVTEAYRQTGWLVQAYIPRQNLEGAVLTVQIIENIPLNKPMR
jgi:hemolysin activation/secretion protein